MCVLPLLSYLTYVEDGARSEENTRDGSEPKLWGPLFIF